MRRLVVTENISVDGVIDLTDGWFTAPGSDGQSGESDLVDELRSQMETQDGLLLGRRTFESFRSYWPEQADDETGITAHLNRVQKFVLSTTLAEPGWENTTILRGPLEQAVRDLRGAPGEDLCVTGSISVVHGLIAAGLVDEYRLFVHPVVVGRGARLFEHTTDASTFKLLDTRRFASGVVLVRYTTR